MTTYANVDEDVDILDFTTPPPCAHGERFLMYGVSARGRLYAAWFCARNRDADVDHCEPLWLPRDGSLTLAVRAIVASHGSEHLECEHGQRVPFATNKYGRFAGMGCPLGPHAPERCEVVRIPMIGHFDVEEYRQRQSNGNNESDVK